MGYRRTSERGAFETTLAVKKEIEERFGMEAIAKARLRLCSKCKQSNCFLHPITTSGQDCPYFEPKEVRE